MPRLLSVDDAISLRSRLALFGPALAVLALGLCLSALAATSAARDRQSALELALSTQASNAARLFEVRIEQDVLAIERMGARLAASPAGEPQEGWVGDARNYLADKPWLQALEWADEQLIIRLVEPLEGNEAALDLDLSQVSAVIDGIRNGIAERRSHVTGAIDLVQGGKGMITYYPAFADGEFRGLLIGVLNIGETVEAALAPGVERDFRFTLREAGAELLSFGAPESLLENAMTGRDVYAFRGVEWEVAVTPTRAYVAAFRPWAVWIVSLISLALTGLGAAAVLGLQYARRSASRTRAAIDDLMVSEARYDLTVTGLAVGVWDWDLTSDSLYLSYKARDMAGVGDEQETGVIDVFFDRLHPEDVASVRAALDAHLKDRKPYRAEFRLRHESGRYLWCLATGQAIWDEDGRPLRIAGSIQDITAEHWAEEARRVSEERLRAVIESAADAVLITDIDGVITDANPACESVFGYPPETLLGQNASILSAQETYPRQAAALRRHLRVGGEGAVSPRRELLARKRDGRVFPLELSVTANRAGDAPIFIAIARDLTPRRKVEAEREAFIEQLETANAELERFSYAASHDLREPLRMVASFSELLIAQHGETLDASAQRALQICNSSARRMQFLLDDLLAFSRTGSDLGRVEDCSPADLIEAAMDHVGEAIEKSGAQIDLADMPSQFRTNPIRFIRVFQNLIGNAVKYGSPGEAPLISIFAKPFESGYLFTVADQGIGMKPEYLERIFEPFARLHSSSSFDGTGMGLAICRKIVVNAGGRIWAESTPGQGSRFHVYWPDIADESAARHEGS